MGLEYQIKGESDPLLRRGHRLGSLSELPAAARAMTASGEYKNPTL